MRYLIERSLSAGEAINEYAIGVDVFERPPSFDPRIESIVRTEVGRLRQKLKEYYSQEGSRDRVLVEIPLRSYQPTFEFRDPGPPVVLPPISRPQVWRWFAFALIACIIAASIWFWMARNTPVIRSLVVLPFQSFSPDRSDEYLSDGLTDELTNELANWKELRVVARTSAYQYKGKGEDVRQIGRELNVDAVLEGSVARHGDRIRVTAQLNRTSNGYHLWSQVYDARSDDMLSVQRRIAQEIASAIRKLGIKVPDQVVRVSTHNPEALDIFLRASYQYSRLTPESVRESIDLFKNAIAKDPGYVRAYVGLAAADMELANFEQSDTMESARGALQEALRLDPDSGDAHGLLAGLMLYNDGDWPGGEREYQLAIEKGAQASTRAAYGWTLAIYGRYPEAQAQCTTAETQEPLGVAPRFCQFYVYYYQRQFADARKMLMGTLKLNPDLIYAHDMLARIALAEKDCEEAGRHLDWLATRLPEPSATLGRAYGCACRGETGAARELLGRAAVIAPDKWFELAMGFALIGDTSEAIAYLRKAEAGKRALPSILRQPAFDAMAKDPRFIALEKMAGLVRP